MDYDQLIKNWHTKASDEDYFSKFTFEYMAFNALLRKKKFKEKECKNDQASLQKLKQDNEVKRHYLSRIVEDRELGESWNNIINELNCAPLGNVSNHLDEPEEVKWWNCSSDELNQQPEADRNKIRGIIYSTEDWENMIQFWYAIRNNLFHGGKNPNDARDQLLVKNGYITLSILMEILLSDENL